MDKCTILVLAVLLCSVAHVRTAIHDESSMDNNYNLCSNVEVREVASNLDFETGGGGGYQKLKRAAMWFGPRMGKRGPDSFEELGSPDDQPNNIQVLLKRELEGKLGPDSPWIVYLVTGKFADFGTGLDSH